MSSFDLNEFRTRRETLSAHLGAVAQIARELKADALAAAIETTQSDMKDDSFRFVVVGEFSRGKSTVINALLCQRLLPSAVEPTTAVLTRISGGRTQTFKLLHRDGRNDREITLEEFRSLVAPAEPGRSDKRQRGEFDARLKELRSLSMVQITSPASICNEGVEIIDTPGTNDLDPLREQITYDYIPRADAILFVLTARQAFTQSESAFLVGRVLKADVERIFFLLNFADTLTAKDLAIVEKDCLAHLATVVHNPRLFSVSARAALRARVVPLPTPLSTGTDGGFTELELSLASFLQSDRAHTKLSRPRARGIRFCDELLNGPLVVAKSTIGLELPDLERRIAYLSPKLHDLQESRRATVATLRIRLENRRRELVIVFRDGLHKVASTALEAIDSYEGPVNQEELSRSLEKNIAPVQSQFQTTFRASSSDAFAGEFSRLAEEIAHSDTEFSSLFKDSQSPQADFRALAPTLTPGAGASKLWQLGGAALGLALLPFFAPLAILAGWLAGIFAADWNQSRVRQEQLGRARNWVDARYRGTIPEAISQFEAAWQQAVDQALTELTNTFERRCEEARNALQDAMVRLIETSRTVAQAKDDLGSIEMRILEAKRSLESEAFLHELR